MRWRTGINKELDINLASEAEMKRTQDRDERNLNRSKGCGFEVVGKQPFTFQTRWMIVGTWAFPVDRQESDQGKGEIQCQQD